jgi:LemA protein
MKKKGCLIAGISIVVIILFVVIYLVGIYNSMVEKEQLVKQKWSQVENQYQRRADLIPNLVNTVKGYAKHEKETLTEVVEARSKATAVNIDPSKLSPDAIKKFQAAQDGLSQSLSKLMVVVERYPDLKANENFMQLQAQLEGTENRISVERKRYNEAVQEYNTYLMKFPTNIFARMFGFKEYPYFEAEKGAEKAPEVKF